MKQMRLQGQASSGSSNVPAGNSKRVPLERKGILKFHHFGGFFIEYSANVSQTGMFIKTESPKPEGSVFIFEIWLGDEHKLVHGVGEVVWVRREDEGSDRPSGMGISFLKIDDESRNVIQRVITEQIEKGGRVFDLSRESGGREPDHGIETERRTAVSLPESDAAPADRSGQLVLDEELLGAEEPEIEMGIEFPAPVIVAGHSGSSLRTALILAFVGALIGGLAYLVSADLLPF